MENIHHDVHTSFILEPLENILMKGLTTGISVDKGINSFPIGEYFMQSLFLRMTGAQEQKMKCICWELATNDFQYRNDFLRNKDYGECSSYKDKNEVLSDIFANVGINKCAGMLSLWDDVDFDVQKEQDARMKWEEEERRARLKTIEKKNAAKKSKAQTLTPEQEQKMRDGILSKPYDETKFIEKLAKIKKAMYITQTLDEIREMFDDAIIVRWSEREYIDYLNKYKDDFDEKHFCTDKGELLDSSLQSFYKTVVYDFRNRCAHNTISYQRNLPSFDVLSDMYYYRQNFFFRYALLILIDRIFVKAYELYLRRKGC